MNNKLDNNEATSVHFSLPSLPTRHVSATFRVVRDRLRAWVILFVPPKKFVVAISDEVTTQWMEFYQTLVNNLVVVKL